MFAHMPGIRTVMPSSPSRAYGLLLAAIRDPDPVVFLEPTRLYRLNKAEVEDDGKALPLDTCFVLREGEELIRIFKASVQTVERNRDARRRRTPQKATNL